MADVLTRKWFAFVGVKGEVVNDGLRPALRGDEVKVNRWTVRSLCETPFPQGNI